MKSQITLIQIVDHKQQLVPRLCWFAVAKAAKKLLPNFLDFILANLISQNSSCFNKVLNYDGIVFNFSPTQIIYLSRYVYRFTAEKF